LAFYGTRPRGHCSSLPSRLLHGVWGLTSWFSRPAARPISPDAFHALDLAHIQGVLVLSSPLFGGNPQLVAGIAARKKVPTISLLPDIAREGGLLAYGPDIQGVYRQAGGMVRKVLQGTNPAQMPAERPTRFELIANLKTTKALGLDIPATLLARADEVIE
jgi:putative ABC transport system substrate-binding protein